MPDVIENCLWRFKKNNDLIQDVCMVIMWDIFDTTKKKRI